MRTESFRYTRAASIEDAIAALGDGGVVLAGGQSLVQTMKLRQRAPAHLVDVNRVAALTGIEAVGGGLRIGALVRQREIVESAAVAERFPWLAEASRQVADVQVRNRGTVGGSLCFADPNANLAPVLIALGAEVEVRGPGSDRRFPVEDLFTGYRTNSLADDELLTAVHVPGWGERARGAYLEVARQPNGVPLVNVAVTLDGDRAGMAVGGVADRPLRVAAVEQALAGADLRDRAVIGRAVGALDLAGAVTRSDVHAPTEYRLHVVGVLLRRALERLATSERS